MLDAARRQLRAPAATAAVVVCGRLIWADASGVLQLGSHRSANDDTLFILNSSVKTVVATMVMREIQDGRLSLDTKLARFYPWLVNARRITVRMLLGMRSGLPEYLDRPRIASTVRDDPRHDWTIRQILTGLGSGLGTPKFAPGTQYQYSDTNYIVLGGILQLITHRSIQQNFEQLIARPAGITGATFDRTVAARALMAHPYIRQPDGSLASQWIPGFGVPTVVWGPVFTDGGLAASSVDMAQFGNALLRGRLVNETTLSEMTKIGPGNYGLGIRGRTFDGHFWVGHRGYYAGFEAEQWTDPSREVTVAVMTNLETTASEPDCTRIWSAIVQAYDRRS